jgi:Lysophospholipase
VLCLHGFPDHAQSWAHFLDRLAQEGYWAVAPALRGYWAGGAAPDGSYRALATGQDVLALIEALGAEQADLIGHDFGARAPTPRQASMRPASASLSGWQSPMERACQQPSSPTAISNDEAGICSSSTPVWPRQPFSSTTLHSSTGSGENGRRGTCCRRPTVLRSMRHLANPES